MCRKGTKDEYKSNELNLYVIEEMRFWYVLYIRFRSDPAQVSNETTVMGSSFRSSYFELMAGIVQWLLSEPRVCLQKKQVLVMSALPHNVIDEYSSPIYAIRL